MIWNGIDTHPAFALESGAMSDIPRMYDALRKTPKWYLRDWSEVADEGKRVEMRRATGASFALQLVAELPHEPVDCFEPGFVGSVPLRTFLSQLP